MNESERRTGGEVDIDAKVGAKFLMAMVVGLILAFLVISLVSWGSNKDDAVAGGTSNTGDAVANAGETAPIELTLDTGQADTEPTVYELEFTPESTLLELMEAAGEPAIAYRGEGKMAFIESIGGVASDTQAELYWRFYVNGHLANQGFGAYIVEPGDVILWKREKTD